MLDKTHDDILLRSFVVRVLSVNWMQDFFPLLVVIRQHDFGAEDLIICYCLFPPVYSVGYFSHQQEKKKVENIKYVTRSKKE